jgi:alpha-glucosidase
MNQLSNHDHSRFLTRTNRKVGRLHTSGHKAASAGTDKSVMRLAVLIQMTWPGSPCVYYGDEAGLAGWTDPDDRRPYPWGNEDREMIDFHKCLIAIRSKSPGLRRGSLEYLAAETGLIAYCRYLGVDKYITVINNSDREKAVLLPVWRLNVRDGAFTRIVETSKSGFNTEPARIQAAGGYMSAEVAAGSGILLRAEES